MILFGVGRYVDFRRENQLVYLLDKNSVWLLQVVALRPAILILDEATSMVGPRGTKS